MTIIEVPSPPAGVDDTWPWWWVYEAYSRMRRADELAVWGHTDRWAPTPILVAFLQDSPWHRTVLRAAVREGGSTPEDVLGVAEVRLPTDEAVGSVAVSVVADVRGQGIGSALLEAAEKVLGDEGRTTVFAMTAQAPEPEPGDGVVTAPTGSGRVDLTADRARFAAGHGFDLEQVIRMSQLDVPTETADVEEQLRAAAAVAGPDYRVHTWNRTVPQEYHARLADVWSRMSTDAPSGDLDVPPETWDAARVATHLERAAHASQQVFVAAAEHVPTGELVAFTVAEIPDFDVVDFGFQADTLVVREHRGKRLGMLVKAANLLEIVARRPKIRRLHTDNAEENRYMLAINEALGFRGVGVVAAWQKRRA